MKTMMTKTSKPVGSRVRRPLRHLAEGRKVTIHMLAHGREKAIDALIEHARVRAIRHSAPAAPVEPRGMAARVREWALDKAARVMAWKYERDTWRVALERQKLSFNAFVKAMQDGVPPNRLARD